MAGRAEALIKPETVVSELIKDIDELPYKHGAFSLAVQIEMKFSLELLGKCLKLAEQDYLKFADYILDFLRSRWQRLEDTAALSPYSRETKVNRAFILTAKSFSLFHKEDLAIRQILNFDTVCDEKEKRILHKQKEKIEKIGLEKVSPDKEESSPDSEDKIYKYIYDLVFDTQSIKYAMSSIPKKDEIIGSDNWETFLDKIIPLITDRKTFIRIVSYQVERKDWPYYFSRIELSGLYKHILMLDLRKYLSKHQERPASQQDTDKLNMQLLSAADEVLHKKFETRGWGGFFGTPGEDFKVKIEAEHGCENQSEVSALAFALIYSYSRIREKLPEYSTKGTLGASMGLKVNGRNDKVDACKIIMDYILAEDVFTEQGLYKYVEARVKEKNDALTPAQVEKFKTSVSEGALNTLLSAMFEVQRKVARNAPKM